MIRKYQATALAVMLSGSIASTSVNADDLSSMFGPGAVQMTEQEMAETNGEFGWTVLGVTTYVVTQKVRGEKITLGGLVMSAAPIPGLTAFGTVARQAKAAVQVARASTKSAKAAQEAARLAKAARLARVERQWKASQAANKARGARFAEDVRRALR